MRAVWTAMNLRAFFELALSSVERRFVDQRLMVVFDHDWSVLAVVFSTLLRRGEFPIGPHMVVQAGATTSVREPADVDRMLEDVLDVRELPFAS